VETALRLAPRDPYRYIFLKDKGIVSFSLSRYEDAASAFEESIASNPEYSVSYLLRAASLALAGLMHPLIYANPKVWVKTLF